MRGRRERDWRAVRAGNAMGSLPPEVEGGTDAMLLVLEGASPCVTDLRASGYPSTIIPSSITTSLPDHHPCAMARLLIRGAIDYRELVTFW